MNELQFNIGPEYSTALETVAPGINGLMVDTAMPGESWETVLQRLLPMLAATYQQRQILNIQLERAKAGLPPIDAQQFGAGVNVGIAPELQKMLLISGAALLAVLWFASRRKA
jgi:hypothetical protein